MGLCWLWTIRLVLPVISLSHFKSSLPCCGAGSVTVVKNDELHKILSFPVKVFYFPLFQIGPSVVLLSAVLIRGTSSLTLFAQENHVS